MKIVIIGGVAGGATAAARIRRLDEKAEIVVFEKTGFMSYANCGLPYYISGVISSKESLTLQTPQSFKSRYNINMRVHHEVIDIKPEFKKVVVMNLETNEVFEESYDKLLISTGAKPFKPFLLKNKKDNIFTLRTVEDTFKIKNYIHKNNPKSAMVIGGGFIGLEVAENLCELGLDVTIIEGNNQLMTPFDNDMASFIHNEVRKHGVKLILNKRVEGIEEKEGQTFIRIKDSGFLTADMVILAIGVTPDTKLAKLAGLELGIKESIIVNDKMETSIKDIYAVGDAVQIKHYITDKDVLISLAGPANKQARIAADNICGGDSHYNGGQGSSIIKVFDLTAASTGINEKNIKMLGINYDKVILSPASHAGYYPGGKTMTMKVLFEKDSYRILGAQIIGFDGVDKRIDVLATAIRASMKAYDLTELDLAYAPPYSSAKDPVNMAGCIIENLKNGIVKQWYYEDYENLPHDGSAIFLDTRTVKEYEAGHINGFINIPVDELRYRLDELDKTKSVYVICRSGLRSYIASRILTDYGIDAYNFAGGFLYYETVYNDNLIKEKERIINKNITVSAN